MHFLRGFKNLLEDIYLNKEKVEVLADKILDFQIQIVRQWGRIGVDGVSFSDDWGTQNSLIIHPKIWRKIFKPRYKKLFDVVHEEGMHAFLHSDGQIYEVIPDLIECGVDVLEAAQPRLLGMERVSRNFRGRVCFWAIVDKQKTLVSGTEEEIREEARKLIELLGCSKGGFIAMADMQDIHDLEIPQKNFTIMCETFEKFGKY